MKYMLLMQFPESEWTTKRMELWPQQDRKAHLAYLGRMVDKLKQAGEFVETHGLTGPEDAKIVHAQNHGTWVVTDGPFPESKEFLAGFLIVDVETAARAFEIAAEWSAGPGPGGKPLNLPVHVRGVLGGSHGQT